MCWRLVEYTFDDLAKKDAGAWDGYVSALSGVCSSLVKPQNPPTGFLGVQQRELRGKMLQIDALSFVASKISPGVAGLG